MLTGGGCVTEKIPDSGSCCIFDVSSLCDRGHGPAWAAAVESQSIRPKYDAIIQNFLSHYLFL